MTFLKKNINLSLVSDHWIIKYRIIYKKSKNNNELIFFRVKRLIHLSFDDMTLLRKKKVKFLTKDIDNTCPIFHRVHQIDLVFDPFGKNRHFEKKETNKFKIKFLKN